MRKNFKWLLRHPAALMMTAVALWMLYPPIVNYLIDQTSVFYVAAVAHSFAGFSTLILAYFVFVGKNTLNFGQLFSNKNIIKIAFPTALSGILIAANHLLLYAALDSSEEFDVIAILVFETWPILFFLIDSVLRRDKRKVSINDYIFSGAAFAGFIVLTVPNMDLADWMLFDSPMLTTLGLAGLGGLAMSVNCYFRMKCMDAWSDISSAQNLGLSDFKRGLLTETGVRLIAAPLLIVALFLSGQEIPTAEPTTLLLLAFVGIVILALGSLLYDLSVFSAENASISALWYLMPVGAVVILAFMQGRLLNQYEAVASVLIVASNIFLVLRYPLRSSLLILFVSVCSIGIWILFTPVSSLDSYYDLLAVSTIFFVLLATFALERTTALNRERESLLGEFNEHVMAILERLSDSDKRADSALYIANIKLYVFLNLHSFVRAFKNIFQLTDTQNSVEKLKYLILPALKEDKDTRAQLLGLFRVGDKLQTMESDRLPPEEFVILIFLGAANIFFSLIFRPETLSSSLFALIVSTSMIYLLLIIIERDKYSLIRHDHALISTNLMTYVQGCQKAEHLEEMAVAEKEITIAIKEKSTTRETRARSYWIFSVFAFLFVGFAYAFFVASLQQDRSIENSPLTSTYTYTEREANVSIALLDWPSAQIKGYILAEIINEHTKLSATMIALSNTLAFKEMDDNNGAVDIHPELWIENNGDSIRRYVDAFGTVTIGNKSVIGSQGLCYTEFEKIGPSSLTITQLSTPKMTKKYDLSGDGKGDIWIGENGWASTEIEQRRLSSYGLDLHYNLHVFDSEVLDMLLERNNQKQLPSLFFCYYPDDVFMENNVHFIDDSVHNEKYWDAIIHSQNDSLPKKGTSWPQTKIQIAYRSSLSDEQYELKTLLNRFFISNKELVRMLALVKKGKSTEDVAKQWITLNRDTILEWLTGFPLTQNHTQANEPVKLNQGSPDPRTESSDANELEKLSKLVPKD